jgi:hypothetical protein
MPTSPEQILSWLTRLRVVHEAHAKRGDEVIRLQNAAYIEALRDMDPKWLGLAVDHWVKHGESFPKPVQLRKQAANMAENSAARAEVNRLAIAGPVDGSACRNEAIQLLGDFDLVLRRTLDASSPDYANLLAECALWWQGNRPPGGLRELDQQRQRGRVGRDLERFASERLTFAQHLPEAAE